MGQGFWVAFPRRHWLSLPLWKTQWGLSPDGTGYPCRCGKLNGGFPPAALAIPAAVVPEGGLAFGCLSPLPLALFLPPIPPTPFPGGEGGDQSYFLQGASPLASPGMNPGGTGSRGGEARPAGYHSGRFCKCRRQFNAGVPGAEPPAK